MIIHADAGTELVIKQTLRLPMLSYFLLGAQTDRHRLLATGTGVQSQGSPCGQSDAVASFPSVVSRFSVFAGAPYSSIIASPEICDRCVQPTLSQPKFLIRPSSLIQNVTEF